MTKWNRVEDSLPELDIVDTPWFDKEDGPYYSERVLIFDQDDCEQKIAIYSEDLTQTYLPHWLEWETGRILDGVTHWCPLPENPDAERAA